MPVHAKARPAGVDLADCHLVLGERAGLVRADDGRRAERLDRGELADDGAALRHALHAEREGDGRDRREPLGDGRDREAHRLEQELVPAAVALQHPAREEHAPRGRGSPRGCACRSRRASRSSGVVRSRGRRISADRCPSSRARARRDDDRAPLAANDARADEEHRRPVAERRVVRHCGARVFQHGDALARERALLGGQVDGLQQARVRGDRVAGLDLEHVAGHELRRRDHLHFVASTHARVGRLHLLERLERGLGATLLEKPEQRVEHDDEQNGGRRRRSARASARPCDRSVDDGDHGRDEERENDRVRELPEQLQERALADGLRELVRAVTREARRGFAVR